MGNRKNHITRTTLTRRRLLGSATAAAAFMIVPRHVLGAIAWQFPHEKLLWDGKNLRFTNNEKANVFVKPNFRKGWELKDIVV